MFSNANLICDINILKVQELYFFLFYFHMLRFKLPKVLYPNKLPLPFLQAWYDVII